VQQQLHPAFRRLADDLYAIINVPLVTALTGGPVALRTLSGQLLQLPVRENDVITPGSELVLPNQGMPVFGDAGGRRGALHVRFNVNFPSVLSRQQQLLLRHTLQVRRHAMHNCYTDDMMLLCSTSSAQHDSYNIPLRTWDRCEPQQRTAGRHKHDIRTLRATAVFYQR
jgi:DnaJ-class molecular chaperone